MFFRLVLLFTLIPMAELYLLIEVGRAVGVLNTVALVMVTAFLGASLTRRQGMLTLRRMQANLNEGVMPAEELFDAVLIFAAGVVLITPGFLTDSAGLLLLIPRTRLLVKQWLKRKFRQWIDRGDVQIRFFS